MSRPRARTYDRPQYPPGAQPRICDHPGCSELGEFRAPRSRASLHEYFWFCLEHVRAYNASWDFYRGMSEAEVEASRRADIVGGRPSWPLGARGPRHFGLDDDNLREALRRFFTADAEAPSRPRRPPTQEEEALAVLELDVHATAAEIKARYKVLAKRHHPDANGGDKAAEDRLKSINQAYTYLKSIRTQAVKHAAD
ncbi:MAG: DnaJ domain-containing protein [Alphaproteobacteria bacterium]|nr:DnaJ domain-containing protein [Alphaproteobacteria bacterium]